MRLDLWVYSLLAALLLGSAGGWVTRGWRADAELKVAIIAEQKAAQAASEALTNRARELEAERATSEAKLDAASKTIRELYRGKVPPIVDCAAPDGGRRLLIELGAGASSSTGKPSGTVSGAAGAAKSTR